MLGRENELSSVRRLMQREEVLLVTLTGPGGTGKTRLSLQLGADLLDSFLDGVYFVELAPITDPALVAAAIAHTLGLKENGEHDIQAKLKTYLQTRQLLLILDNFEQVVPAAGLLGELLRNAPQLKLLVTSREVLHIYGEYEYVVPPLALPDPQRLPSAATLSQYAAVELFIQRAQMVRPDFHITNESAPAVAEICARLDGLPLAIELAAARTRLFSPQVLLQRLQHPLSVLTGGSRDRTARQQTLRGAIDWSFNLLDAGEQLLFARLGIFINGWSLEAAEAICADQHVPDLLDGLQSLVDKSLVRQGEAEGELRFTMLDTLHEYALECLARLDEQQTRTRHLDYFSNFAQQSVDVEEWLKLDHDLENLRGALQWTLHSNQAQVGLQLATTLWPFWERRGYFSEARDWLKRLLVSMPDAQPELRALAMIQAGRASAIHGAHTDAAEWFERAINVRQAIGDTAGVAAAMSDMGIALRDLGDYPRAQLIFEVALEIHRSIGNQLGLAVATDMLGCIARNQGNYSRAESLFHESFTLYEALGESNGMAVALHDLAEAAQLQGDWITAAALYERSILMFQQLQSQIMIAWSLHNQGYLWYHVGEQHRARANLAEALRIFRELQTTDGTAACLAAFAAIDISDPRRAARLLGASDAICDASHQIYVPIYTSERAHTLAMLHAALDTADFEQSWQAGRTISREAAISFALNQSPAPA